MEHNLLWDDIKQLIHYEQVIQKVRNFWYGYTEGYFEITPSYRQYSELLQHLHQGLPLGWKIAFDFNGTIHASYYIQETKTHLIIQKDFLGKEYLQFHPIIK